MYMRCATVIYFPSGGSVSVEGGWGGGGASISITYQLSVHLLLNLTYEEMDKARIKQIPTMSYGAKMMSVYNYGSV